MSLLRCYHAKKQLPEFSVPLIEIERSIVQGPDIAQPLDHAEEELCSCVEIHICPDFSGSHALGEKFLQGIDVFIYNITHFFIQLPVSLRDDLRNDLKGKPPALFNGGEVIFHCHVQGLQARAAPVLGFDNVSEQVIGNIIGHER